MEIRIFTSFDIILSKMKILNHAVEAVQIGLDDYGSDDPRRAQSALRNIFAGMLLLFKEKLRLMSPSDSNEVLVKQLITPTLDKGRLTFIGKGKKTVDLQQIKDRFTALDIKVEWAVIQEIGKLRNNIEHYYPDESPAVINEVVSKSFKIINDFCRNYLNEEPVDLFGQKSWDIFLEADEIYKGEKKESIESLSQVDWTFPSLENAVNFLRCTSCHSDLIHAIDEKVYSPGIDFWLSCKKCQNEFKMEDVIEECVHEELAGASYIALTDGGDDPYVVCPECDMSTYVYSDGCCLNCGYVHSGGVCFVCGTPLNIDEGYQGEICSYHKWALEKADD